ncbi:MAG: nucleotide exchange factor GrpE [Lachnospiraceae bacterium]|nr:nucleotide exchange factor GrpE [Lachnospiraceae bacterium]
MSKDRKTQEELLQEGLEKARQAAEEAAAQEEKPTEPSEPAEPKEEAKEPQEPAAEEPAAKDPRDAQIEDLKDRVTRQMAEFDNYRKRTDKEKAAQFDLGARHIIERILPVVDNFERGLAAIPEEERKGGVYEGMDKIYKQLSQTLADLGVKPIEAVGQPFDPNLHNAVMHVEDDDIEESVVVEEFQKGYMYKDAVVRVSMVKVAN